MPMHANRVHQSPHLQPLSRVLTDIVNNFDMAADRSVFVHVFDAVDTPHWRELPTIWHLYDASTIMINMSKVYATAFSLYPGTEMLGEEMDTYDVEYGQRMTWRTMADGVAIPMPSKRLDEKLPEFISDQCSPDREARHVHKTFTRNGQVASTPVNRQHPALNLFIESGWIYPDPDSANRMLYNLLMGAVMREAGYSVFNQSILKAPWFAELTGYQKNIVAVFEELRVEYQQILRLNGNTKRAARKFMRSALPITANTRAVVEDMTRTVTTADGSTGMTAANIALNSSLILGRTHVTTLLRFETTNIRDKVAEYIDADVMDEMEQIWAEYIEIDGREDEVLDLVERWQALFPSRSDGSNAQSSLAPGQPKPEPKPESEDGDGKGSDPEKSEDAEDAEDAKDAEDSESENSDGDADDADSGDGESSGGSGADSDVDGEKNETEADAPGSTAAGQDGDQKTEEVPVGVADPDDKVRDSADFDGKHLDEEPDTGADPEIDNSKGSKGGVTQTFGNDGVQQDDPDAHDPGIDEIIDLNADKVAEEFAAAMTDHTDITIDYDEQDYAPDALQPSRISFADAVHRWPSPDREAMLASGREIQPSPIDHRLATQLSKTLENLNVQERGKFTTRQVTPPGRMKSRAAVQQAAERSMRLPQQAKPWSRTKHTVDLNPPLTIGVMTDVSSSQGWAERVSAELSWILSHAVNKIGGRVACVSFGMGITITQRPGEIMPNAQVVRADDGGELFDQGAGTLDYMLNLRNGTGTRMLFVLTDGRYGQRGQLQRAATWVDELVKSGAYVVWVTPDPQASRLEAQRSGAWGRNGLPFTPRGTIAISAADLRQAQRRSQDIRDIATRELITNMANEITKAVQANRRNVR